MPELKIINRLLFVLLLAMSMAACSKSADESGTSVSDSTLLQYVPADSPYVFASLEPLPEDVLDALESKSDAILRSYGAILRSVVNEKLVQSDEGDLTDDEINTVKAVVDEIATLLSIEGLRGAGIDRQSTIVFYGDGLLPVMRMRLTDGDLMEQTIVRIEEKAGGEMSVATIDGQEYRYAGNEEVQVIVALADDDLVVSVVPASRSDALLKSVLGLSKPDNSMADSGELQTRANEYGLGPNYLLLLDFARMAATFVDDPSGTNQELLALMDYDEALLSDVCKDEIREMAGVVPRLVAGYTEITAQSMRGNTVLELRSDIAEGLATLVSPVQGLGTTQGGLFSFGMSLDLLAARDFYAARLDALEEDPYECEHFAEFQAGVAAGRAALDQPVPPIVYTVKGFLTLVDAIEGLDFTSKQPPTAIDASFLVAMDNPQGLLAMGTMFSPELAALNLQADGKPVKMDLPPLSPALSNAYVAMTDNALAVSLGSNAAGRLAELLAADFAEPPPFMSMDMDAGKYYGFIGEVMDSAQGEDKEVSPALTASTLEMMRALEGWFGRMSFNINFTERGVEMTSTVELIEEE